jgi:3-oxoadipate enol-lactonase
MTLSYDVAGSGPTAVLLHSTVCDRRMWDAQVPALVDAGYRVVRCDFQGFGQTAVPEKPYSDAEDVVGLLDVLGIEQAALIGASGGGLVALEIAARWPQRVTSLALLCSGMKGHTPSAELKAFGEREETLLEAGDVTGAVELHVDTWLGPDADEASREKLRQMQGRIFELQLPLDDYFESVNAEIDPSAIMAPSLLISGRHDFADFRQIATQLSGKLVNVRHLELPWAGHLPSLERPDETNRILIDFLHETP